MAHLGNVGGGGEVPLEAKLKDARHNLGVLRVVVLDQGGGHKDVVGARRRVARPPEHRPRRVHPKGTPRKPHVLHVAVAGSGDEGVGGIKQSNK